MGVKQHIEKFCDGGPQESLNYLPMKTGATAGVDYELNMGYGAGAVTLDEPNCFGNLERFTGVTGTQVFNHNIIVDHGTWRKSSGVLLMYYAMPISAGDMIANIEEMQDMSPGGFTGWKPANPNQLASLVDWYGNLYGAGMWLPPFNTQNFWRGHAIASCADWPYEAHTLRRFTPAGPMFDSISKSSLMSMAAVRAGNVSEII